MFIIIFGMVHYRAISCTWTCLSSETYVKQIIISRRIKRGACVFCLRLCECSQWSRKTALTSKGCCVEEKMDAYRLYSLCVAGGPRQPLGLLQDEDRSCDVIRRTLDLVWRQSQEVRSGVREFQRQIRAAGMVSVGATGHHTSHEIGYRRLHPREHGPAAAWVQAMRLRECHPTPHAPPSSSLPGRSPHGDADSRRGRKQNTQDPRKVIRHSDPSANTEIKAEQALSLSHTQSQTELHSSHVTNRLLLVDLVAGSLSQWAAYCWQCWRSKVRNPDVTITSRTRCNTRLCSLRKRRWPKYIHIHINGATLTEQHTVQ